MSLNKLNAALDQVAPSLPARFRFSMAGTVFSALVEPDGEAGCRLLLDIDLGRIPYSAEAPEARRHKLALLGLPGGHFASKAGRLLVSAETRLKEVPSRRRLVATALSLALSLRPEMVLSATSSAPVTHRPGKSRQPAWAA